MLSGKFYSFRLVLKVCLAPFLLFQSSSTVFTFEMLVSNIYVTFWNLSKFQKYIYNMIYHKVDNILHVCVYICLCVCVYTHDFSLIQGATIRSCAGAFEVHHSGSERLWVTAGFFLQYFGILSWLPHCDDVEPRGSAGERKEINVPPFSLAYAKYYPRWR